MHRRRTRQMVIVVVEAVCTAFLPACGRKPNNAAIVSAIQSELTKTRSLNDYYVRVESRNGAVTVTGVVPNVPAKQSIAALVTTTEKPSSFVDSLSVAMPMPVPSAPNGAGIETSLQQKLSSVPALAKIEVTSNVGVVTLKGYVANARDKLQAEKLAEQTGGVQRVVNQLLVSAGTGSSKELPAQPHLTVSLKATPSLITPGKSALLKWSSQEAKSLDLEPGIGRVQPKGSRLVSPRTSTTFTLIARGEAGRATAAAHVNVWNTVPPPTITASVLPLRIEKGQSAKLTWQSQDATSVDIEPGIGQVGPSGSVSVAPAQSTQYELTATGAGGRQATTIFLTVTAPPRPVVMTIPPGTTVEVLTIDPVDSGSNQPNDVVRASLAAPLQVGSRLTLPEGSTVYLRVLEVHPGERSGQVSEVRLVMDHLIYGGHSYPVYSTDFDVFGLSHARRKTEVANGITRGLEVQIAHGTRISFQLTQPVRIVLPPADVRVH